MAIKVVKGLIGSHSPQSEIRVGTNRTTSTDNANSSSVSRNTLRQQLAAGQSLSDAVISNLRASTVRQVASEKIREFKVAKAVSDEVAEKIRETDEPADDVHSEVGLRLSKDHLIN